MPLPAPPIDRRTYREVLEEAIARVPAHNPEWTNLSEADPGVTLLQLFAFMTESIIYRANRIPERNRLKFLRLLGIPMQAAVPAVGFVAFEYPKGPLVRGIEVLDADQELLAGPIPFRTQNGLDVLPIQARIYYKARLSGLRTAEVSSLYRRLYASFERPNETLEFYETKTLEFPTSGVMLPSFDLAAGGPTIDGSLWLALLARDKEKPDDVRREIANKQLTLGVMPAFDQDECVLPPEGSDRAKEPGLTFELPNLERQSPAYKLADFRTNGNLLARPGLVTIDLPSAGELDYWKNLDPLEAGTGDFPPSLEDSEDLPRLISWIRIRVAGNILDNRQVTARFSWIGINAAQVIQRARVRGERLPNGTGESDQAATLSNTPVLAESVRLTVNGEEWLRIDDLLAAAPEVPPRSPRLATNKPTLAEETPASSSSSAKVYTVDRESGEIRFGDGIHGHRPPRGATIQATYDFGGGKAGLLGIGSIRQSPTLGQLKVSNPVPTWGGSDGETVAQAEQRIPRVLKHRNRLVSSEDFEHITRETPGVELGRVEVLSLFHPDVPQAISEGVVSVLVIPKDDPVQPDAPRPDRLFLETICNHLEPRRLVTTELHVVGPDYVPVWVSVGLDVVPGFDAAPLRERVARQIRRFLSAIGGGFEERGWPLNKAVEAAELQAVAGRVAGVAKITGVTLAGISGETAEPIPIAGLQLPRLVKVAVAEGDAVSIEDIRGEGAPVLPDNIVPVPVIPEEC